RSAAATGFGDALTSVAGLLAFLIGRGPGGGLWCAILYPPARFVWERGAPVAAQPSVAQGDWRGPLSAVDFLQNEQVGGFGDEVELGGGDIVEGLSRAAGPLDFDELHNGGFPQAEVGAQIALREIAAATGNFADLRDGACGDPDARTNGVAVA